MVPACWPVLGRRLSRYESFPIDGEFRSRCQVRQIFDRAALVDSGIGEIVDSGRARPGWLSRRRGQDEETKIHAGGRVWHRTGDAGYFDRQGRLWLLGRCAAKVTDRDGTLYPLAVEAAASDVPGVQRSAFVAHHGRRILVAEAAPAFEARDLPDILIAPARMGADH